mgnify:FL=1
MKTREPQTVNLHPTLWRTCRVLANVWRLRILELLFRQPGQSVTRIAARLQIPISLASRYLRDLNARGLLQRSQRGFMVQYAPAANRSIPYAALLLTALERTYEQPRDAEVSIFRLATAFTHPRRVVIARVLASGPLSGAELCRRTGISRSALKRHLKKLRSRGLIQVTPEGFALTRTTSPLASALIAVANTYG